MSTSSTTPPVPHKIPAAELAEAQNPPIRLLQWQRLPCLVIHSFIRLLNQSTRNHKMWRDVT